MTCINVVKHELSWEVLGQKSINKTNQKILMPNKMWPVVRIYMTQTALFCHVHTVCLTFAVCKTPDFLGCSSKTPLHPDLHGPLTWLQHSAPLDVPSLLQMLPWGTFFQKRETYCRHLMWQIGLYFIKLNTFYELWTAVGMSTCLFHLHAWL